MGLYVTGTTYPVNVFHNGATLGHRALLYRSYDPYPTHEITVALLSNLELEWRIKDEREADELVGKVKFAVTQNNPWRNEEESVEKHTQWILELDLQKYVGHYRSEEIAAGYDVKFDVGASSLQLSRKVGAKIRSVPLMQIGNDKFLAKGFDEYLPLLKQVTLTFVRGSITSVNRFYLTSDIDHERFAKFSFVKNEI